MLFFSEFELPVGCKICTLFLTDEELLHIFPLDQFARRHCKITDFTSRRESDISPGMISKAAQTKLGVRRQTCPNIASSLNLFDIPPDHVTKHSDQSKPSLLDNVGKGSFKKNANFIGVDRHSGWGKGRTKISLSHVPIVECQHGESPADSATETLTDNADDSYFGKSYRSSALNEPYNPLNLESLKADDSDNDSEDDLDLVDTEKESVDDNDKSQSTDLSSDKELSHSQDLDVSNNLESEVSHSSNVNNTKTISETQTENDVLPVNNYENGSKNSSLTKQNGLNFNRNFSDSESDVLENGIGSTIQIKAEIHEPNTNSTALRAGNINENISDNQPSIKEESNKDKSIKGDTYGENFTEIKGEVRRMITDKDHIEDEKENINPAIPFNNKDSNFKTEETLDLNDNDEPCISCLELRTENPEAESNRQKCAQCLSKKKSQIINHFADRKEVIDFSVRSENQDTSGNQIIDASDTEQFNQSVISTDTFSSSTLTFSSSVSTDSTISRFWTHEMEGLNDVTLYIQCHSDISLLLLMDNPEQYQENLLHSIVSMSSLH